MNSTSIYEQNIYVLGTECIKFTDWSIVVEMLCGAEYPIHIQFDIGQWKLTLQKEDHNQYGFISLLNSKMGFVRDVRLPRHVVPMDYSLNLTAFIIENNYTVDGAVQIQAKVQQGSNDCSNKVNTAF